MVSNQVLFCSVVFKFGAMFIGVCGNIVVIYVTLASKFWSKEKTETSYLVGNLALADLFMCLTLYPTWIVEFILTILDFESNQLLFCKFSRSFAYSFLFASVYSPLAISVDRYIYIVKPLKYPLIVTRRRVFAVISAIWLTACYPFALTYYHFYDTDFRSFCWYSRYTRYPLQAFITYVPVTAIIILNLKILLVSRKQCKKILAEAFAATDKNDNEDQLNKKTRMKLFVRFFVGLKAAKTFSIVVAVLTFCIFAPTVVSILVTSFCSLVAMRYYHVIVHYEFYGINSVVNAFIYGMRHVKYRNVFAKLLFKITSKFKLRN